MPIFVAIPRHFEPDLAASAVDWAPNVWERFHESRRGHCGRKEKNKFRGTQDVIQEAKKHDLLQQFAGAALSL
jgi:hypothetical protein